MAAAGGAIHAWAHVEPQHEPEFNDWYDLEHLPLVVRTPGILSGRRYSAEASPMKYLAWYDTADESIEGGAEFRHLVEHPTPWSQRMHRLIAENRSRMGFQLMRDVGEVPATDTQWLYIVHTDIPDDIIVEYNEWYDQEHLPRLVTVPGVVRARRYAATCGNPRYLTAYELTDPDAFESPEGLKARKTPWTEKMRSLFRNTRRSMCKLIVPSLTQEQALRGPLTTSPRAPA